MHAETHDAIDKFIELVRQHHPEDVAELRLLFFPLPISDGQPDPEPELEAPKEPEPEQWEIDATFGRDPGPKEPARTDTCVLTDALLDLAKQRRFTFGKHGPKGGPAKTVYEVYIQDPSYLEWALANVDRLDFQMRQIITALIEAQPTKPNVSSQDSYSSKSLPSGWGRPVSGSPA